MRIHCYFAINVKNSKFLAALTTSVPKKQYVAVYVFHGDGSMGMVPWGWLHVFLNTLNRKRNDVGRVTNY